MPPIIRHRIYVQRYLGQIGTTTYGNGITTTYEYHPQNNRLSSITTDIQEQGGQNATETFAYDSLNRLVQAQSAAYGTIEYDYDQIGSIIRNSRVSTYDYTYNPTKPHAVATAGPYTYSYDANGNMTSRIGGPLTYDYENRLSGMTNGATTATFVYDYAGNRVEKISGTGTTTYIGSLYECTNGVCAKHIFAGGARIASKYPTATYYYHTDHLGSSNVITDASGAKVGEVSYYPFGETRIDSGPVHPPYKYTGQEEDDETGLYYYRARYYDPVIGRFTSPDAFVQNFSDPQTLNRFGYARNNPLVYRDPSGHFFVAAVVGAVIGAIVGGTTAAIMGGDVGKGMLFGGISGAFLGAAGGIINDISGATLASAAGAPVTSAIEISPYLAAGIHAGAGAMAGGITSAIDHGNVGLGMLTGGISGGFGKFAGGYLPDGFGYQLAGRTMIGGVAGGMSAEIYGGSFRQGFAMGARTGALGFLANDMHDRIVEWFRNIYNATETGVSFTGIVPVIDGLGPAGTITYVESQEMLCVSLGVGASYGRTFSYGPILGDASSMRDILEGWSFSGGYQITRIAGASGSINSSGAVSGPTFGVPGFSFTLTYGFCY